MFGSWLHSEQPLVRLQVWLTLLRTSDALPVFDIGAGSHNHFQLETITQREAYFVALQYACLEYQMALYTEFEAE